MVSIDSAYILAGGRSRRMGRDKLFMDCGGEPLVTRTLGICREAFASVTLLVRSLDKFKSLDCEVLLDNPQAQGPLAGVIAALEDCAQEYCFITAADLYDLDTQVIDRLCVSYCGEQYLGLRESDLPQPLCGIYHRLALPHLKRRAAVGQFRMIEAITGLEHRLLPIGSEKWRNINCPSDLVGIGVRHG